MSVKRVFGQCLLGIIVLCLGCASPSGPDTILPSATEVFTGTVYPQGRTTWPFMVTSPGTVTLTLTSLDPSSLTVGLGLGAFANNVCTITTEAETRAASASPQVTAAVGAGENCVEVFDVGGVPLDGAPFSVTIRGL